ncbi:hypothetical protein [Streptomyces sp. NPDC030920]|uniref:hypothetical protein n=1 Tax=Streptomyces sp. NPDC030920 TaxID=3365308 RepID=UPI00384D6D98
MATFPETERYIQFLLEQLAGRNEHHVFEQIVFQIALRRLSSNIVPATGPVSAGGDQGRDAESYYTNLPHELSGAGARPAPRLSGRAYPHRHREGRNANG